MSEKDLQKMYVEVGEKVGEFFILWKGVRGCPSTDTIKCECSTAPDRACESILTTMTEFMDVSTSRSQVGGGVCR